MSSKKNESHVAKHERGIRSKLKDQEELLLTGVAKNPIMLEPPDTSVRLKVEMTQLTISERVQEKILETYQFVRGEEFAPKKREAYKDKKTNLSYQYWMEQGSLTIQGITISKKPEVVKVRDKVKGFACEKLKKYGFHDIHIVEALKRADDNVGKAFELLMSKYMSVPLPDCDVNVPEDVIQERTEELGSLKEIFGDMVEENIPNQLWLIHLDLPYIVDNYTNKTSGDKSVTKNVKDKSAKKNVCEYFKKGMCKYGSKCKNSHDNPKSELVVKSAVDHISDKSNTKFDLEIRFPEGCLYPNEPALVAFCPQGKDMPSTARLRLSYYLQNYSKELAEIPMVCGYSLIDLFNDKQKILSVINDRAPSPCLLDPATPLFPTTCIMETLDSDNEFDDITENESKREADLLQEKRKIQLVDDELVKQFKKKKSSPRYNTLRNSRKELPAFSMESDILNAVKKNQVLVVSGATGCGKSTQVPQFLLDNWLSHRKVGDSEHVEIICTQPRRLSAIGVAERVAFERMEHVGLSIGYQIRLESKMSAKTRLTFCTTGILLRRLESDPLLSAVSHIIVDEVHERSEESDFLLLLLKKVLPKRPDMRVILMSATLNANLFCDYFDNSPIIDIPGRTFPVEALFLEDVIEASQFVMEEGSKYSRKLDNNKRHMLDNLETEMELADIPMSNMIPNERTSDHDLTPRQLCYRYCDYSATTYKSIYRMDSERINFDLIQHVLRWIVDGEHDYPREGSILVFLPGMNEIRELHETLKTDETFNPRSGRFKLIPLHSSLSSEEQAQVFSKVGPGVRKVVLSTNIAETSITIDDCVFVVDSGRMKEKRFDSNKNMESLETVWVSRANALQRKGRAGRVRPGVCVHLYTHHHFKYQLMAQPVPEIQRVPLEQTMLRIKMQPVFANTPLNQVLGELLEPPSPESISGGVTRLVHVGALDRQEALTPLGCHLASLPVDVRIGKLLLYGAMFNCLDSVLTISACLGQKSPFLSSFDQKEDVDQKKKSFNVAHSDHFTNLLAYNGWRKASAISRNAGYTYANENMLSVRTMTSLVGLKGQFLDYLAAIGFVPDSCRTRKRATEDNIPELTGPERNVNGQNWKLLAGLLSAALYPNIVKVLSPEKFYAASVGGAVPKSCKPEELKFKTKSDGYVFLHPSSVNHSACQFHSPYLVFQEKMKTSKIFIRDCTMVPELALVMFSSNELQVELNHEQFTISLEDGWIVFLVKSNAIGEMLQSLQIELIKLMDQKIKNPQLDLNTDPKGKKIISTITELVSNG